MSSSQIKKHQWVIPGYEGVKVMDIRPGEWVYGCPRDWQVISNTPTKNGNRLVIWRDLSRNYYKPHKTLWVATPRLKHPHLAIGGCVFDEGRLATMIPPAKRVFLACQKIYRTGKSLGKFTDIGVGILNASHDVDFSQVNWPVMIGYMHQNYWLERAINYAVHVLGDDLKWDEHTNVDITIWNWVIHNEGGSVLVEMNHDPRLRTR